MKREKCYMCEKGTLQKKPVDYFLYGQKLGQFPAEVCNKCGEQFFSEETSRKMTALAKEKGLWGLYSKAKVGVSGHSVAVRISKRIADYLNLQQNKDVGVYPIDKRHIEIELL